MTTSHRHTHVDGAGDLPAGGITTIEHLIEHLDEFLTPSSAIVCIGNELRGDDGAGVVVGRKLAGTVPWRVHETQTVPESFLMKIVADKPESMILVDGLHFGAAPGAVELVEAGQVGGQGPSTHGPAPLAFLEVFRMFHACRQAVLGIQLERTDFGEGLTDPVAASVDLVVQAFRTLAASAAAAQ